MSFDLNVVVGVYDISKEGYLFQIKGDCRENYFSMLYNVHCTLYSVQCTLYNAHCTMHTIHCTVYV